MSRYRPYDEYEPNEPSRPATEPAGGRAYQAVPPFSDPARAGEDGPQSWTTGTWERPMPPERSYTQRTWDEEDYLPNESPPENRETDGERGYAEAPSPHRRATRSENPYARPTWDETAYTEAHPQTSSSGAATDGGAYPVARRTAALHFDADADTSPNAVYADPSETAAENAALPNAYGAGRINPYARPDNGMEADTRDWSERYAPPLKFDLPESVYTEGEPADEGEPPPERNVYRTRRASPREGDPVADTHTRDYRVEADAPAPETRPKHTLRRWIIALVILAVLGTAAYLERDWVLGKLKLLLGEEAVETVQQAVGTEPTPVGYDAAPTLKMGERAKKAVNAVAGGLGLETVAVTANNIVSRVATGENTYDFYLFASADGKLLGYYDGLPANGFLVCPDDVFYVAMPPYLIDGEGKALLQTERYAKTVGTNAVLSPMINGWAMICDQGRTTFNYINADGDVISTLWFSKAYPFTGEATLAYVDTGNVTDPEERYALYELTVDGTMAMWRHTAGMEDVLGCACGVTCMADGDLILLDGRQTVLCVTDDVALYVDCGAIVVRDPQTGKYGLFVDGEQREDFIYDGIAPIESDQLYWRGETNGLYRQYTVTGLPYPLPLSHYFQFIRDGVPETVALATSSVYPILLGTQN